MSVSRPPRRAAPPLPGGEVALEPPPAIPPPTGARWQQLLAVLPMLAGTMATAMMFGGRDGASPYTYVVGGIFGLSTLGMLAVNWGGAAGPRKAELMRARRDYLRYISGARGRVRATIAAQRDAMHGTPPRRGSRGTRRGASGRGIDRSRSRAQRRAQSGCAPDSVAERRFAAASSRCARSAAARSSSADRMTERSRIAQRKSGRWASASSFCSSPR